MTDETSPGIPDEPDLARWCELGLWDEEDSGTLPVVVRSKRAGKPSSLRILLVDEDPWILEKLGGRLIAWGLGVCREATIARCCKVMDYETPDLVVLDARLLDGEGLHCVEQARLRHPDMPMLLTGAPGKAAEEKTLRIGARELLARPFRMVEVKRAVFAALGEEWVSVPTPDRAEAV